MNRCLHLLKVRKGRIMKKKWVTIFPRCENVHITKEVGAIPGVLSDQLSDYDCYLVSWNNGEYPNETFFFPKLHHKFIKKYLVTFGNKYLEALSELLSVLIYLKKDGKTIDIIHFFHLRWYTSLLILFFKKINPNGKVYVKLDAADSILNIKLSSKILPFLPIKYGKILEQVDVVSIETKELSVKLSNNWEREVVYIPNGYYPFDFKKVEPKQKKKQIIHVSRMGAPVKNSEFLIRGIIENKDILIKKNWKVLLVGDMTNSFENYLDNSFNNEPELRGIIEYCGIVSNKEKLLKLYSESRILIMTSKTESFGIALVEALATGNQLLTSNIISAPDIVSDKENGFIYETDNMKDFSEKLIKLIQNKKWEKDSEYVQKFAKNHFYYPTIIERLMRKLNE